jgi:RNA polymerase sigma-70 factor (ECF subfamily)
VVATDPTPDFLQFRATGDPGALSRVFDAVAPRLLLLALHLTRNRADAEDVVQETFVAAIDAASDFDSRRDVRAWLSGILAHRARDLRRRRARRPDPDRVRTGESRPPLDEVADVDALERIDRAIDALPQPMREVLVLRLHHGLTGREIARALGRSVDTVHTQLRRGLEALRQRLPAGLAALLARLQEPGRGLENVRDAVLENVASPAAGSALLLTGGVLVKKLVLACAAALAVAVVFAEPWRDVEAHPVDPVTTGEPATRTADVVERAPGTRPGLVRRPVAEQTPAVRDAAPAFEITGRCVEDRTGEPIAGGAIRVSFLSGDASAADHSERTVRATTGQDGRFRVPLEVRPTSRVRIEARAQEFVGRIEHLAVTPGAANADAGTLRLTGGWRPTGLVVLRDGSPAPTDLWLHLRGLDPLWSGNGGAMLVPDASGRFACTSGFPPGPLSAQAGDGWHVVSLEPATYEGTGPEPSLRIVVEELEGSLAGVVVDRRGTPVAEALVSARSVDGTRRGRSIGEALTDEHGRFEILAEVPYAGPVRVEVRDRRALRPVMTDPRTFQWGDRDLRVEIDRLGRCVLEVVDAVDGTPVPFVSFRMPDRSVTSREPSGRFDMPLAPGTHEIVVTSGQGVATSKTWIRVDMPADDARTIRVAMPRVAVRVVRVRAQDGSAVEGSDVQVARAERAGLDVNARLCDDRSSRSPSPSAADALLLTTATTGADGEVRVGVPQPPDDVWLLVRGAHVPRVLRVSDIGPDDPIEVVVDRGRVIPGQVAPPDALRRLGGDVRIRMEHTDDPKLRREVPLGSDGSFEVADAADGTWRVVLIQRLPTVTGAMIPHRKLAETVTISADTEALRLDVRSVLDQGAVASVTIRVLRDGLPLRNARLQLAALRERDGREVDGLTAFGPRPSDDAGTVRFECVPPGRYRLVDASSAELAWSDDTLDVGPGEERTGTVDFRSRTLRAQLADAGGSPTAAGQLVRLHSDVDPRTPEARTDSSGTVVFGGLGPGPWRVVLVTADGDRPLGEVTFHDGDRDLERSYEVR